MKLRSRGITTSIQLCDRLLEETGVAMLPGTDFGRPANELTARIAFVDFDGAHALVGAEGIPLDQELSDDFLALHCNKVLTALDRLCSWLE